VPVTLIATAVPWLLDTLARLLIVIPPSPRRLIGVPTTTAVDVTSALIVSTLAEDRSIGPPEVTPVVAGKNVPARTELTVTLALLWMVTPLAALAASAPVTGFASGSRMVLLAAAPSPRLATMIAPTFCPMLPF